MSLTIVRAGLSRAGLLLCLAGPGAYAAPPQLRCCPGFGAKCVEVPDPAACEVLANDLSSAADDTLQLRGGERTRVPQLPWVRMRLDGCVGVSVERGEHNLGGEYGLCTFQPMADCAIALDGFASVEMLWFLEAPPGLLTFPEKGRVYSVLPSGYFVQGSELASRIERTSCSTQAGAQ